MSNNNHIDPLVIASALVLSENQQKEVSSVKLGPCVNDDGPNQDETIH